MRIQAKRGGPARPLAERFKKFVDQRTANECWEWLGSRRDGYGQIGVGKRSASAHRVAYELAVGPIPAGLHILHLCDNPGCVNPAHLRADTSKANTHEAWERGLMANRKRTLRPEDVIAIRASTEKTGVLVRRYGISRSQVARTRSGKRGDALLLMLKSTQATGG